MGTRWIAGVFLVALAVIAGCGGDDDSSTAVSSASKEAFIEKMDAICKRGNTRMAGVYVEFLKRRKKGTAPTTAEYEGLVDELMIPNLKREIKEIEALTVPSGDQDEIDEIIVALEEGVETAEENPRAVAISSDVVFGIASRLAAEYGLEVCGSR
jgi:hypothetical protein